MYTVTHHPSISWVVNVLRVRRRLTFAKPTGLRGLTALVHPPNRHTYLRLRQAQTDRVTSPLSIFHCLKFG
jgi:hypothetical protein